MLATALMSNVYKDLTTAVQVCVQIEETNPSLAKGPPAAASAAIQSLMEFDIDDSTDDGNQALVSQINRFLPNRSPNKRNNPSHPNPSPSKNNSGGRQYYTDDRQKQRSGKDKYAQQRIDTRCAEASDDDSDEFLAEAVSIMECLMEGDDDPYPTLVAMVRNKYPSPPRGVCLFCGDARHYYARCFKLRDALRAKGFDQKWDSHVQRATRSSDPRYNTRPRQNDDHRPVPQSGSQSSSKPKPTFSRELTQEQCDLLDRPQPEN